MTGRRNPALSCFQTQNYLSLVTSNLARGKTLR